VLLLVGVLRFAVRGERRLGTPAQRTGYETLRTANLVAPELRSGLQQAGTARVTGHLRSLLGTPGVVLADLAGVLASENVDEAHRRHVAKSKFADKALPGFHGVFEALVTRDPK
jgi:hypothetical protein